MTGERFTLSLSTIFSTNVLIAEESMFGIAFIFCKERNCENCWIDHVDSTMNYVQKQ